MTFNQQLVTQLSGDWTEHDNFSLLFLHMHEEFIAHLCMHSSPCHMVSEEVVHASLSVTAMSRVQQNLLFSSTYPQPIFNLLGVVMEHFKSLLLAFGKGCDAF